MKPPDGGHFLALTDGRPKIFRVPLLCEQCKLLKSSTCTTARTADRGGTLLRPWHTSRRWPSGGGRSTRLPFSPSAQEDRSMAGPATLEFTYANFESEVIGSQVIPIAAAF